jgi:serine/threonine protein kinase
MLQESMENYERLRMLGKGSYGKAWLVAELKTKEQFVIKEIRVQNQREMEEALAEAAVLSKLNHINIIKFVFLIGFTCF